MIKINRSKEFIDNIDEIKDDRLATIITQRILRLSQGNFGDTKSVGYNIYELRIHYGAGYRIYYTIHGQEIIFLLCAGSKSDQKKDILKAKKIAKEVKL
ncbi:MAG: type II toxin-antitoxin system RelE/ParE family toxin [Candidatus Cloacimonetes bacterium]|nr:type II toxin-antitoxin system RelE/ParE family toxin [Candidatus Cloacimonadota bacterium]